MPSLSRKRLAAVVMAAAAFAVAGVEEALDKRFLTMLFMLVVWPNDCKVILLADGNEFGVEAGEVDDALNFRLTLGKLTRDAVGIAC